MATTPNLLSLAERDLPQGSGALSKGLYVLEIVGELQQPARFNELVKLTGFSKGTLHRILATLIAFRLIRLEPQDQTYRLGHRLFELAHQVWDAFDIRGAAAPELDRLARQTAETVSLCELHGEDILYIEQRSGGGALAFRTEVGRRAPAYCSAGGKAIMAFMSPHLQRALLSRLHLQAYTETTVTTTARLESDLALVRARGYALSEEEHIKGVSAVAAPVFDHNCEPVAALVVSGPRERLSKDLLQVTGRDLMAAARRVSTNVGAAPMSLTPYTPKPVKTTPGIECVLPWDANVGEGPLWLAGENRLYWVDILAPAIHCFNPENNSNTSIALPHLVGALTPRASGGLVALTQYGLETFDIESGALTPLVDPEAHISDNRFNDAKCDRRGRLWAGTMRLDASTPSGALYRFDGDGRWQQMDAGFTVSNGLDWSPDSCTFYFVDSLPGIIYAYDFDLDSGAIARRRVFVQIPGNEGRPDGIAVDSEGFIWCAVWDGWCIRRYAPDGRLERILYLPVPRPTSCAFGGEDLKTLYITSARVRLSAELLAQAPYSGSLFTYAADVAGMPAQLFAG